MKIWYKIFTVFIGPANKEHGRAGAERERKHPGREVATGVQSFMGKRGEDWRLALCLALETRGGLFSFFLLGPVGFLIRQPITCRTCITKTLF